jgi:hypothetical protein
MEQALRLKHVTYSMSFLVVPWHNVKESPYSWHGASTLRRSLDDVRNTHIEGRHFTLKRDDGYFRVKMAFALKSDDIYFDDIILYKRKSPQTRAF